ncbi:hypothetical protein, partial [Methylomonas albis]
WPIVLVLLLLLVLSGPPFSSKKMVGQIFAKILKRKFH